MKKTILILSFILLSATYLLAQTEGVHIYNPDADAREDIATALKQAIAANKHVLLQIGGNWCPWCVKLDGFMAEDAQVYDKEKLMHFLEMWSVAAVKQ